MKIVSGKFNQPRIVMVYGEPGIGKTTLASRLTRKTLLIDLEGRSGHVSIDRVFCQNFAALRGALTEAGDTTYDVIAIDTLDRAQDMCMAALCKARGWESIETPGYGRGYVELRNAMVGLADDVENLRSLGKGVLLLCHAMRARVEDPVFGEWDRWSVRLNDTARASVAGLFIDRCDVVALAANSILKASNSKRAEECGRRLYMTPHAGRLTKCIEEPRDVSLDDAPELISRLLLPDNIDDKIVIAGITRRLISKLGSREALLSLLNERNLDPRALSVSEWQGLEQELTGEEIPE